jgi:hypothetical protein
VVAVDRKHGQAHVEVWVEVVAAPRGEAAPLVREQLHAHGPVAQAVLFEQLDGAHEDGLGGGGLVEEIAAEELFLFLLFWWC